MNKNTVDDDVGNTNSYNVDGNTPVAELVNGDLIKILEPLINRLMKLEENGVNRVESLEI